MEKVTTCLWFDTQAEDEVKFYSSVFKNLKTGRMARYNEASAKISGQEAGSVMTLEFNVEGTKFLGLNGGPQFKFSPAISLSVACESESEIREIWEKLSSHGKIRMGLDKYPWAPLYGWTSDKFGLDWQLTFVTSPRSQKVVPSLLFTGSLLGKGEEAIKFYTNALEFSKVERMVKDEKTKTITYSEFKLRDQLFSLMEGQSPHDYESSMATSFVIYCENQFEIDKYWNKLQAGGGSPGQCGWLKDKYGFSWQIVPSILAELLTNPATSKRTMKALLTMHKLDIEGLKKGLT